MQQQVTRYAKSGDVHVAYQLFGEGPLNLVLAPLFVSNIELFWERPVTTRWLLRLASYARVAMFDKRGTGMSDRVSELPGLDQRIDDLRAVMDAAGMEQAALMGISEGGRGAFCRNLSRPVPRARTLWQLRAFHILVPD
jgi:pimeloyl-ACP methyl ester carboxylesterase